MFWPSPRQCLQLLVPAHKGSNEAVWQQLLTRLNLNGHHIAAGRLTLTMKGRPRKRSCSTNSGSLVLSSLPEVLQLPATRSSAASPICQPNCYKGMTSHIR